MSCSEGWRSAWEESPKSSMPSISEASHGGGKDWESRTGHDAQTFKTSRAGRAISAAWRRLPGFLLAVDRARRQSRPGDAEPRRRRCCLRRAACRRLFRRHRRRHGGGDGDHGERPGRPAAGGAGCHARRHRRGRSLFRLAGLAHRHGAASHRSRRDSAGRRASRAAWRCRWSTPRAMPRWRRCSRASCCCSGRLALDVGAQDRAAHRPDHRRSTSPG